MPFSIVYRSLPMRAPADVILDIIRAADKRNLANGVSGMLYYDPVQYFQVLQGPKPAVLDIFSSIADDNRHVVQHVHELYARERFPARRLPMGYVNAFEVAQLGRAFTDGMSATKALETLYFCAREKYRVP